MSNTPRTDAVIELEGEYTAIREVVSADFARELERELDDVRNRLSLAKEFTVTEVICGNDHSFEISKTGTVGALRARISELEARIAESEARK